MRFLSIIKSELVLPCFAVFFFNTQAMFNNPNVQARKDYISPPIEIKYLTNGFATQASDSFWLRAIQDMDYCEQPINEKECSGQSWLFSIINMTVELDKNFTEAYYYGALALSILVSDYSGASIIFDKGVKIFNKNWQLLYAAGYHAMLEEKDKLKASNLYLSAFENGAPDWVRLMAGRLASEGGNNKLAKEILQELIKFEANPLWIEKLRKKIDKMEASN